MAAAVLLALAIEAFARLWIRRQDYFVHRRWDRAKMCLDRNALPSMERVVTWETNSDGERGDPLPRDREGLYRVLVAGGSATECGLLDQGTAWPAVVQSILNRRESLHVLGARRVHVGNIGRSMTPVSVIVRFLERTLHRYDKLDLFVLMPGASDAIRWMEETQLDPAEDFAEDPHHRFRLRSGKAAIRKMTGTLWRRFARPFRQREDFGLRLRELRRLRQEATRWLDTLADPAPMLDRLEKDIRRCVALAQARKARVIVIRQAWFDKIFTPEEEAAMWGFHREDTYFTHAAVRGLMWKVDRRVERVARELGVEQVDLMPVLEASLSNFYDFLHFTPDGARQVAGHVAAAVLAPELVPERMTIARVAMMVEPA
jgi:hypothetical protein